MRSTVDLYDDLMAAVTQPGVGNIPPGVAASIPAGVRANLPPGLHKISFKAAELHIEMVEIMVVSGFPQVFQTFHLV